MREVCSPASPLKKLCCTLLTGGTPTTQDHSHSKIAQIGQGVLHDIMSESPRQRSASGIEGAECPSELMSSETRIHQIYLPCVPGDAGHVCSSVRGARWRAARQPCRRHRAPLPPYQLHATADSSGSWVGTGYSCTVL